MNLIRYYNQNRKKIWGILIIIFFAFILLQLFSYIHKETNKKKLNTTNSINIETNVNTNNTKLISKESAITGETMTNEEIKNTMFIIDQFISFCNNKELEQAYNLLTDECKNKIYHTLESFEQGYYNDVFGGEVKKCSVENWVNNIYKVKITEDILSTGRSNNGYSKQDYITVKKEENGYKLNINNYIGNTEINQITKQDNISMEVLNKDTYMEYEEYTIKVTNETENTILLDGKSDVKSLYLQDSNGKQYSSYSHQLTEPMLTISSGETKEVTIRFYSAYQSTKEIQYIVFSDLLLYNGQLGERIEFKAEV